MKVDFFKEDCRKNTNETRFGICDDEIKPSFITTKNEEKWIATVINDTPKKITFTAIDKCVFRQAKDLQDEQRCDCMIEYDDNIIFIELKDQRSGWKTEAIEQLENTIKHFIANHDLSLYKHKKAYACNKAHPQFQVIEDSTMKRFFLEYRVWLNVQAKIIIR